jgi:uncharacterized RDD family membrane protein YckC
MVPPPPPPTGQPGYGPPVSGIGAPADLMTRFLARLIDLVLVGIVNAIVTSVLVVGLFGLNASGLGFSVGASFVAGAVSAVISAALYLGYFAVMESRNGQTVGKMLLKLQTQGPDGGTPTMEQAVRRNIWVAFGVAGVIPIIGGVIGAIAELVAVVMIAVGINNSPTRQAWNDNFAGGTQVIKIG